MTERELDKNHRNNDRRSRATKEITAGFLVFRRSPEGPKFLLLYHRGSYWNFPKGHLEHEEKSLDAALRETYEETGLRKNELRIIPNFKAYEQFYFRREKETIFKIVIIYLAETRNPVIKIGREYFFQDRDRIQGYGWFLFNEAKKILGKYKENQKILEQAYNFIRPRGERKGESGQRVIPVPRSDTR